MRAYYDAIESRRAPDASRFHGLIALYKASTAFTSLQDSTRRNCRAASTRSASISASCASRSSIARRKSGQRFADKPRTADYNMQVLSRVLSYAVELGKIAANPCEGIKALYAGDRSEIIWTDTDIESFKTNPACSPELALAVDLASYTGLRLGDRIRLASSHVDGDAIIITTGKSREKREAIIPIYD